MARHKLRKFAELATFPNVFAHPETMKGKWNENFFHNSQSITLELGCGKGEYTLALARKYPDRNFIGIDIKGVRIWKGAKTAIIEKLGNVAFVQALIDKLEDFFLPGEISEIWIPFPDPYSKPSKAGKRLVSPGYLSLYRAILVEGGIIQFKSDNTGLYEYLLKVLTTQPCEVIEFSDDLYSSPFLNEYTAVPTYFENIYKGQGEKIKYVKFRFR